MKCPCHSQKEYKDCCEPFHTKSSLPATPTELMRSRYSAYALDLAEYIIETTYKKQSLSPQEKSDWLLSIHHFSQTTQFQNLRIISAHTEELRGFVTFHATLNTLGRDSSFTEESLFRKENGKWLYVPGSHKE